MRRNWYRGLFVGFTASAIAVQHTGCQSSRPSLDQGVPRTEEVTAEPSTGAIDRDGIDWSRDLEEARRQASREGKLLLLWFTGSDWCSWCQRLQDDIFASEAFRQWAGERMICVELDYPRRTRQPQALKAQNERALEQYQTYVTSYPTVLIVDASGEVLLRMGYEHGGPQQWVDKANRTLQTNLEYASTK